MSTLSELPASIDKKAAQRAVESAIELITEEATRMSLGGKAETERPAAVWDGTKIQILCTVVVYDETGAGYAAVGSAAAEPPSGERGWFVSWTIKRLGATYLPA